MFRQLFTNIIMALMRPGINRGVASLREDPDIKQKFKELENSLLELKDATERKEEFRNSPGWVELAKKYGRKDEFGKKYAPKGTFEDK